MKDWQIDYLLDHHRSEFIAAIFWAILPYAMGLAATAALIVIAVKL